MAPNLQYTIESRLKVGNALEVFELGLLLESAIKFFLFQRTQIPVPFNSLYSASDDDDDSKMRRETKNGIAQRSILNDSSEYVSFSKIDDDPELENAHDRTRRMKQERRQKIHQQRRILKIAQAQRQESGIRKVLDNGLRVLKEVVRNSIIEGNQVVAVVLMLGPSMLTSKEIIFFEIDKNVIKSPGVPVTNLTLIDPSAETQGPSARIDSIIRHFFQTVICTSAFGEFTSNQMRSTNTHLNLLTRSPLPDHLLSTHDLRLIEDDCLMQIHNSNSTNSGNLHRLGRCKTLNVRILAPDICDLEGSSNDASIDNISDINSLYCYRLPLIFKGVRKIKVKYL